MVMLKLHIAKDTKKPQRDIAPAASSKKIGSKKPQENDSPCGMDILCNKN